MDASVYRKTISKKKEKEKEKPLVSLYQNVQSLKGL